MIRPDHSTIYRTLDTNDDDTAISVIIKITGETCNINCFYCYEKRKPYPSDEFLTPEKLNGFLDTFGDRPLAIELHGGEPMLIGLSRMKALLSVLGVRKNIVRLTMQTNGTLLNEDWLDLFESLVPNLQLGISLDGDDEANQFRADYGDRSTSLKVMAALDLCEARNRRCGVIAVVTQASLNRASDLLDFFSSWSVIKNLSFVPCFDYNAIPKSIPQGNKARMLPLLPSTTNALPGWAITPCQYKEFLFEATDYWISKGLFNRMLLEPVMSVVRRLEGRHTSSCHFTNLKCSHVLTLYPDGRIGACDELPMPDGFIGETGQFSVDELNERMLTSDLYKSFAPLLDKCLGCSYQSTCGGGCLSTRLRYRGTPYDEEYCEYRIDLIEHVRAHIKVMEEGIS